MADKKNTSEICQKLHKTTVRAIANFRIKNIKNVTTASDGYITAMINVPISLTEMGEWSGVFTYVEKTKNYKLEEGVLRCAEFVIFVCKHPEKTIYIILNRNGDSFRITIQNVHQVLMSTHNNLFSERKISWYIGGTVVNLPKCIFSINDKIVTMAHHINTFVIPDYKEDSIHNVNLFSAISNREIVKDSIRSFGSLTDNDYAIMSFWANWQPALVESPETKKEENLCIACNINTKEYLYSSCGHLQICAGCLEKLDKSKCCICRETGGSYIKLYK